MMPRVTDTTEDALLISGFASTEKDKATFVDRPIPDESYRYVTVSFAPHPEPDAFPKLTLVKNGKCAREGSGGKNRERGDKRKKDGPDARAKLRICGLTLDPERIPRLVHSYSNN